MELQILENAANTWISADPIRFPTSVLESPKECNQIYSYGWTYHHHFTNPTPQKLQIDIKDTGIGMDPLPFQNYLAHFNRQTLPFPNGSEDWV